jgi:hemolysin III
VNGESGKAFEPNMTGTTFPSPNLSHRRADMAVHAIGFTLVVTAGSALIWRTSLGLGPAMIAAALVYVLCALASNLASVAYHFGPWHDRRMLLRRIDHAAIYPSITGTFTPFFVLAGTPWTYILLIACWVLTLIAAWNKVTSETVKAKWSTASYLGLGALGLLAIPDLTGVPAATPWCILSGAGCYAIGTAFYARKSLPFRYAIWHMSVNIGAVLMFVGLWQALF